MLHTFVKTTNRSALPVSDSIPAQSHAGTSRDGCFWNLRSIRDGVMRMPGILPGTEAHVRSMAARRGVILPAVRTSSRSAGASAPKPAAVCRDSRAAARSGAGLPPASRQATARN
ncbi:MAG: hypothetical protein Q4F72_00705 [Desulfovibrionaceae bacterium]|nr:hypothetical protein [Desulfovibrionaceae bacterium]